MILWLILQFLLDDNTSKYIVLNLLQINEDN
jgi:hypothetical protein